MNRVPEPARASVYREGAALEYVEAVRAAYERAQALAGGSVDRFYQIADHPVQLRMAGTALLPYLTTALAHLAANPTAAPSLTIFAWDADTAGVSMPAPPWHWYSESQDDGISAFAGDRFQFIYLWDSGLFSVMDRVRNLAYYWARSLSLIPMYEVAAPCRSIFEWWSAGLGVEQLHAAAVGLPAGGVLLPGKSGSGKSNTALSCLGSDLLFVSDDICMATAGADPTIYSLYSTAKTFPQDQDRLTFLRAWSHTVPLPDAEKSLYFLNDHTPDRLTAGFPLRAILVPRITGRLDTRIVSGTPAAALTALLPSTIRLNWDRMQASFGVLGRLVRRVPCHTLELGTQSSQIPEVIAEFLRSDDGAR